MTRPNERIAQENVTRAKAHRIATTDPFAEVVRNLISIVGRRQTAYIASLKDAQVLDGWQTDAPPQRQVVILPAREVEQRLRLSYQVALVLSNADNKAVAQAWLLGLNPRLDDRVPLTLLREGRIEVEGNEVLAAAIAFAGEV